MKGEKYESKIIFIVIVFVLFFAVILFKWNKSDEFIVADDEIALQIKLDIKEDLGLIIIDYDVNGAEGTTGISNADKSMLKHGESIVHTLNRQQNFDNLDDIKNLKIQLRIITKYIEPNFDFVYPEEYTKINKSNFFGRTIWKILLYYNKW